MTNEDEFLVAQEHFENEEYDEAFDLYNRLARTGSVESQVFLGWMYENGLGINKDQEKAFSNYQNAAKLGSVNGQFYLAKSYAKKNNFTEAVEWYLKAAEKEYSPALFRLGWVYDIGRGVNKDKTKALSYYRRAADQGHIFAQKQLAFLLMQGSEGLLARFRGIANLLKYTISLIFIAMKDSHSERIKD